MKTKIKYEITNSRGYRRSYENEIETFGHHQDLVQDLEKSIELFEHRQEAYRQKWGLEKQEVIE